MSVNDVYRCEVHYSLGSRPTMSVLHMRETVAVTPPERGAQSVETLISVAMSTIFENFSNQLTVVMTQTRLISGGVVVPSTVIYGGAEQPTGDITSDPVPAQAAALISFYTSQVGRSGRGRIYIPGWPELNQSDGQMTAAAFSAFQTDAASAFLGEKGPVGGGATGKFRFCVWSPAQGPQAESDLFDVVAHPSLATQRRRRALEGFSG